ncbi:MAG: pseudouridine synthase [Pseudomonadales bacterium]|mgnify:CR=1 FL=1|nr:pseudouridine synthase [Pseudomonadales bacterium]
MRMPNIILFNKPFQVLSQFTDQKDRNTLAKYISLKDYYPAGRLDFDSEGLLLLTNNGRLQNKISNPSYKLYKTYFAQVEGTISQKAINLLTNGIVLKDGLTLPAKAYIINEPSVWNRIPPIRERKNIPTSWIKLSICEGKNRQVRRMTAAVGFPTLRLIRQEIGQWKLGQLAPGEWRKIST